MDRGEATGIIAIVRLAFRNSRNADRTARHGAYHDHPDDNHGSDPLRFMQRAAEAHDPYRQRVAKVVEHCDYYIKARFGYRVSGRPAEAVFLWFPAMQPVHEQPFIFRSNRIIVRGILPVFFTASFMYRVG